MLNIISIFNNQQVQRKHNNPHCLFRTKLNRYKNYIISNESNKVDRIDRKLTIAHKNCFQKLNNLNL